MNNIVGDLKNLDRKYKNETRLSDSDTIVLGNIESATNQLSVEDGIEDPTSEDIRRKIKENFNKEIDINDIDKIRKRKRNEYSANRTMGEDDEGESVTFGDISNSEEKTVNEYLGEKNDSDKLDSLLSNLEDEDRKLFEQAEGLGEYKGNKKKLLDIAKDNNFKSEYFASKKISDIKKKIKEFSNDGDIKNK